MLDTRRMLRAAVQLTAALTAAGLLAGAGAAQAAPDTIVRQPFAADSGDSCRYGSTKGLLGWHLGPFVSRPAVVDVVGTVSDRPLPTVPVGPCGDDRRFSTATLTAFARGTVVDSEAVRVDNGSRRFALMLTNQYNLAPIDHVVVQVCRSPLPGMPGYCGRRQVYRAPVN